MFVHLQWKPYSSSSSSPIFFLSASLVVSSHFPPSPTMLSSSFIECIPSDVCARVLSVSRCDSLAHSSDVKASLACFSSFTRSVCRACNSLLLFFSFIKAAWSSVREGHLSEPHIQYFLWILRYDPDPRLLCFAVGSSSHLSLSLTNTSVCFLMHMNVSLLCVDTLFESVIFCCCMCWIVFLFHTANNHFLYQYFVWFCLNLSLKQHTFTSEANLGRTSFQCLFFLPR